MIGDSVLGFIDSLPFFLVTSFSYVRSGQYLPSLREILEELGLEIAEKAVRLTKHSKRKTVKSSDIDLAAR